MIRRWLSRRLYEVKLPTCATSPAMVWCEICKAYHLWISQKEEAASAPRWGATGRPYRVPMLRFGKATSDWQEATGPVCTCPAWWRSAHWYLVDGEGVTVPVSHYPQCPLSKQEQPATESSSGDR